MGDSSDADAATGVAGWLVDLHRDHGREITEEELRRHVGAEMRRREGWDTPAEFHRALADDISMTGARPDADGAVIDVVTPDGLRLERIVRVDDEGRLASMVTRLAGGASMTMISAAAWRAAHLDHDDPVVLHDDLAGALAGDASPYQAEAVRDGTHGTTGFHYRWNMVMRGRLAEDTLAERRSTHGTRQYVVLGAGLDSFAIRNPYDDVTVFEIDTPRSQEWKLDRLAQIGIPIGETVRHVACDFETQDFGEELIASGFDPSGTAVAAWLGVSYYLTEDAIRSSLQRMAEWPPGSTVVFDYVLAEHLWDRIDGYDPTVIRAVIDGVAAAGEPFLSLFDDDAITELCRSAGFGEVELLDHTEMVARYLPGRQGLTPGPDPVLKVARATVG